VVAVVMPINGHVAWRQASVVRAGAHLETARAACLDGTYQMVLMSQREPRVALVLMRPLNRVIICERGRAGSKRKAMNSKWRRLSEPTMRKALLKESLKRGGKDQ
jgi:hypothetical protein